MVCGQIHAPATLPNHIHMHLVNRNFLAILYCLEPRLFFLSKANDAKASEEPIYACCCAGCVVSFVEAYVNTLQYKASFTLSSVAVTKIVFVGGQFHIRIFLLSIPLLPPFLDCKRYRCWPNSKQDMLLCLRSQAILLLKGTKHELSVYGKMPILNGFSKACVTSQFNFCPIREGRFDI